MPQLILIRHGQSQWNLENRFTGWTDVDLSPLGIEEAREAGKLLKEKGFKFDCAYTSVLKRAVKTLNYILEEMDCLWLPTTKDYRLNERHYGALQGLNKTETADQYGAEQVHLWRRSYDIKPPTLEPNDPRSPTNEEKYSKIDKNLIPLVEDLKDTVARVTPYWETEIAPKVKAGQKIIIAAHGNSLRALIKHLENISDQDILKLEIPTGKPIVYELSDSLKVQDKYYL
jgi:2,3-bisphosphoglycerate-dependent phosphoglycerate mutase